MATKFQKFFHFLFGENMTRAMLGDEVFESIEEEYWRTHLSTPFPRAKDTSQTDNKSNRRRIEEEREYRDSLASYDEADGCDEDCFGPDPYIEPVESYNRFSLKPDDYADDYNPYSLKPDYENDVDSYNRFSLRPDSRSSSYNRFSLKGDRRDHGQEYYDPYDDY